MFGGHFGDKIYNAVRHPHINMYTTHLLTSIR